LMAVSESKFWAIGSIDWSFAYFGGATLKSGLLPVLERPSDFMPSVIALM
jgi:hypothetical protein